MIDPIDPVDAWHLQRWSRFTASDAVKIAVPSTTAGQLFTPGGLTYIEQKALEATTRMWERPELEEAKSLLHGKMYEYPAYQWYINVTRNFEMQYLGDGNPIFLTYDEMPDEAGGTPDVAAISDMHTVSHGAEIKCPKNPMYHYQRLDWKSQWDIKENYPLCYYQIQKLLLITGAPEWDFISFDERMLVKKDRMKIITVKPDLKFMSNHPLRLQAAVKKKYEIISRRSGVTVRNRQELQSYLKSAA